MDEKSDEAAVLQSKLPRVQRRQLIMLKYVRIAAAGSNAKARLFHILVPSTGYSVRLMR